MFLAFSTRYQFCCPWISDFLLVYVLVNQAYNLHKMELCKYFFCCVFMMAVIMSQQRSPRTSTDLRWILTIPGLILIILSITVKANFSDGDDYILPNGIWLDVHLCWDEPQCNVVVCMNWVCTWHRGKSSIDVTLLAN